MKKAIIISILAVTALLVSLMGCTAEDPGYVIVANDEPVSVLVDNNPGVKIIDSDGNIITIDPATGTLTTIEYEHFEIHSGQSFSCWYLQDVSDTGDKSIISFRTGNTTEWVHLVFTGSATVMAHARMYEAPAITDNTGAPLTIFNRDRNSATTSIVIDTSQNPDVVGQATYFTEATMGNVVGGTEIAHEHLGTGEGKKTLGAATRGTQEWILKPATLYAFVIESVNDDDNTHIITLNWYELANQN